MTKYHTYCTIPLHWFEVHNWKACGVQKNLHLSFGEREEGEKQLLSSGEREEGEKQLLSSGEREEGEKQLLSSSFSPYCGASG